MDISIIDLVVTPEKFRKGQPKEAVITFKGIIKKSNLNPVTMSFETEENSPVFLINEDGDEVKKISWEEEFETGEKKFSHDIEVIIKKSQPAFKEEAVELTAKTSTGKKNKSGSIILYK